MGEGNKGQVAGVSVLEGDKGRPLNREETDVVHRKMEVCKGTRGNPVSGWGISL